jgi:hypothetical protein
MQLQVTSRGEIGVPSKQGSSTLCMGASMDKTAIVLHPHQFRFEASHYTWSLLLLSAYSRLACSKQLPGHCAQLRLV